ncbi:MAG TPA: hypothetical protein VK148_03455 [Xanthobacteraceae bacterium]|jgi:hypothetical protein|nr:hypothetical protein [Xanthobacteraceae bacterium]
MKYRLNIVTLAAVAAIATPAILSAQQPDGLRLAQATPKSKQSPRVEPQYDIEELTPSQIQRAQEPDRPTAPTPTSPSTSIPPATMPPATAAPKTATSKAPSQAPQPQRAVACSGAFAKNSSHINLTTVYKLDNIAFTEVDAPEGKKIMASVLFPKDPKRRLEVWWENEDSRKGTHLIVIGGQSTWTAPKGLKLGLSLAAIEKINGKPFKLKGFDKDNIALITDWQDGALSQLPGGCRLGIYLQPDAKAPAAARSEISDDMEFTSNDPIFRTVKPTISEILIGY